MIGKITPFRPIRSFVRRRGRITAAQKRALETLWPIYGLDPESRFCADRCFQRVAPVIIEIGFGNGSNLADCAQRNPEVNYLGIEVHEAGIGHLMNLLRSGDVENVRIVHGDAYEFLRDCIDDGSISRINLFFPDPWPKKRHRKRRLVGTDFAELVYRKLIEGGRFHAATDSDDYAREITSHCASLAGFVKAPDDKLAQEIASNRSLTRFEKRGRALGNRIHDIVYVKR